ncbi:hypothetical protein QYM36_015876 [Artemia franciscana]|uniref:C3H1-type domain-containing protein n=1 Tax=Artemia franciscana TaxID=6661 RepID=A0AA88KVX8_ARTSF|nr:hypothetical protein QYM36_015876 [Artemia franciscana]
MDQNISSKNEVVVQDQNQASNVLTLANSDLIETPSKLAPDEGGDETISINVDILTQPTEAEKYCPTKPPKGIGALVKGEPSEEKGAMVNEMLKGKENITGSKNSLEISENDVKDQNLCSDWLNLPINELIKTFAKVDPDGGDDETISLPIGFLPELIETENEGLTKFPKVSRALEKGEPSEEKAGPVEDIANAKKDPTDPRPSSEHDENEGILIEQNQYSNMLTLPISELIKTPVKVAPDKREEEHKPHFDMTNEKKGKPQKTIEKTGEANSQNDFLRDLETYLSIRSSEKSNIRFRKPSCERRQLCWFNENSICRNGDRFPYYHKPSMKTRSSVSPPRKRKKTEEQRTSSKKTLSKRHEYCRFHQEGYCSRGDSCYYTEN